MCSEYISVEHCARFVVDASTCAQDGGIQRPYRGPFLRGVAFELRCGDWGIRAQQVCVDLVAQFGWKLEEQAGGLIVNVAVFSQVLCGVNVHVLARSFESHGLLPLLGECWGAQFEDGWGGVVCRGGGWCVEMCG